MTVELFDFARKLRSFGSECGLGLLNDTVEGSDVVHSEVGKNLAVHLDVSGLKAFDEATVGQILGAGASADTLNPQATELSLTLFTVTILIETGLTDGVLGVSIEFRAEAAESFRTSDDAFPAFAAGWAVGCSWHVFMFWNGRLFSYPPQSRPFGPGSL